MGHSYNNTEQSEADSDNPPTIALDDSDNDDDDEPDAFWIVGNCFDDDSDDDKETCDGNCFKTNSNDQFFTCSNNADDLKEMMQRLKNPAAAAGMVGAHNVAVGSVAMDDYRVRTRIVQTQMGNMTLCRGRRGEMLHQSGAIPACLHTLEEVYDKLSPANESISNDESLQAILLATACWGAIRDLSCHNASVRNAVGTLSLHGHDTTVTNGLQLMARYLVFYDATSWQDLATRERQPHLALLTSVVGALRNVTHSTTENCAQLHDYGVTTLLSWRLLHDDGTSSSLGPPALPTVSQPWREAAFRSAATLINMSERCQACAVECAKNVTLVHLLIECWGGKACNSIHQAPLLHVGLAAILRAAEEELPKEEYQQGWKDILANEEKRKARAQRKEDERRTRLFANAKANTKGS